ncbi:glyoxylate/hydroxypyruvate reductase A [Acinetobacter qingfengensis]|uniref:Glyoxylate/hydroxypyruvate reductase A n=1 Tax=Acinetobacter qingfengensis TaxID=1262585 RepID=A0A1E7QYU2_9GAMM|nr:glyoxylate/hydroxypyruvate reductase A [Acinetobacter qingfengensis]KAA8730984.1 glyoxylate/hydroxypyruvate reductase A [Acinetobacter qingfengensis]OEY92237.1 glyoxylate/hydroxypyruvate reductase A [Acinetobacter qingfengensis]
MIVIASTVPKVEKILYDAFLQYAPEDSFCLPDDIRATQATTAACWFPDIEKIKQLPNLQLIHSMAAGVEHLNLEKIDVNYQVCRIVDDKHKQGMLNYLQWGILYYQRDFDLYLSQHKQQLWQQWPQHNPQDISIGIMGLGELGAYVAEHLAQQDYQVVGWSKSPKNLNNITCYTDWNDFDAFLSKSQILINLLPLTPETKGILSEATFAKLPQGAALINSGRGDHLVVEDLQEYLNSGHLRGAILDVFPNEPLDQHSVLWSEPKVLITPHIASHTSLKIVVEQILENDQRLKNAESLLNQIDVKRGY